jgi:hypothetical protein
MSGDCGPRGCGAPFAADRGCTGALEEDDRLGTHSPIGGGCMMNSSGSTVVGTLGAYASFCIIFVEHDAFA